MKQFAYVRASAPSHDLTMISFDHRFVEAEDVDGAYEAGLELDIPLLDGYVMLNYYTFEVTPA